MDGLLVALTIVTALGCGLCAGVFFAFSSFVMKALARLPPADAVAAMQAINVVAVTPAFMAALFGTALRRGGKLLRLRVRLRRPRWRLGPERTTRRTCEAPRSPTATASSSSGRSTPAGTAGVPCTTTVHLDKQTVLTSQLFTNRESDEKVHAGEPYSEAAGRDTYNDGDGIYHDGLELALSEEAGGVLGVMTFDVRRS
jgi:hypothetical protein